MTPFDIFRLIMAVLQGALMMAVPHFSARRFFFAVTVPPGFRDTEPARDALRRYRIVVLAATALAAVLPNLVLIPILPVIVGMAAFLKERHSLREFAVPAATVREADLTAGPDRLPWWTVLALPPFAALGAAALYLRSRFDEIPAKFPVHWGFNGQADRWTTKTEFGVYAPLLFGAGFIVLMIGMGLATFYGSRRSPQRLAILKVFVGISYVLGFVFSVIGLLPIVRISPVVMILPAPIFIVVALWWSARASDEDPGEPTPDECWHLGDIYYNPADPALFVQKRMGWGYTFNFGNRLSWLVLGGFLASTLGLVFVIAR